jgi:hypothetical protein
MKEGGPQNTLSENRPTNRPHRAYAIPRIPDRVSSCCFSRLGFSRLGASDSILRSTNYSARMLRWTAKLTPQDGSDGRTRRPPVRIRKILEKSLRKRERSWAIVPRNPYFLHNLPLVLTSRAPRTITPVSAITAPQGWTCKDGPARMDLQGNVARTSRS